MRKIKEMMNKFYGVKDLVGGNGMDMTKKAWKATGISIVIYGVVVGACALVDKVFAKYYEDKIRDYNNMLDKPYDSETSAYERAERFHYKIEFREKVQKELYVVTSTIGTIIGIIGSIAIIKVLKKK